jgi:hypothetical protein
MSWLICQCQSMSTLGLSGAPDTSDGLWKSLFWPTIRNAQDADLAASRGFWVCFALAFISAPMSSSGTTISVGFEIASFLDLAIFLFYLLGAIGVRQASLVASASMFATYLFSSALYFWLSSTHFSFIRFVGIGLLLANLRAAILIRKWRQDPERREELEDMTNRSSFTWTDRIANRMPMKVWPWARFAFYPLASLLLSLECYELALIAMHHS